MLLFSPSSLFSLLDQQKNERAITIAKSLLRPLAMITVKNRRLLSSSGLNTARVQAAKLQATIVLGMAVGALVSLTGCGQKGDLYLVDNSAAATEIVQPSDDITESASRPQDSAFATLRDDKLNNKTP